MQNVFSLKQIFDILSIVLFLLEYPVLPLCDVNGFFSNLTLPLNFPTGGWPADRLSGSVGCVIHGQAQILQLNFETIYRISITT